MNNPASKATINSTINLTPNPTTKSVNNSLINSTNKIKSNIPADLKTPHCHIIFRIGNQDKTTGSHSTIDTKLKQNYT